MLSCSLANLNSLSYPTSASRQQLPATSNVLRLRYFFPRALTSLLCHSSTQASKRPYSSGPGRPQRYWHWIRRIGRPSLNTGGKEASAQGIQSLMKSLSASALTALASVAVLGLVPAALAHGDEDMNMGTDMGSMGADSPADQPRPEDQYPPSYFALDEHRAVIYGHIGLMVIAWVFMLPVGKLLPGAATCSLAIRGS